MKKLVSTSLAIVLAGTVALTVAGCGGRGATSYNPNIDLTNKPNLSVLMPNSGYDKDYVNNDPNAAVVEEVTGYHVNYEQLQAAGADSQLNTLFMDHAEYNAVKVTSSQFANLIAQDALLPLDDAIDDFGPVLKEVISEESWKTVTVDGEIYGIPERSSSDNIQYPIVFRQEWLDACNLGLPETPAEMKSTLQALREKYNVVPLTFDMYTPIVWAIAAGFGIYAEWQAYDIDGKTEVRYYMDAPNYKDYVDYMADLLKSGLIDQEVSTNKAADAMLKFTSGKAAAISSSIWSVASIVAGLVKDPVEQNTTQENRIAYLRALEYNGEEHANRLGGVPYVTVIPFWMGEEAGYVIDWINSKLTDTAENPNFRKIVLGEEDYHYTYNANKDEYNPVSEHFNEKDTASYYLTGSNEKVYTKYWLARVKKTPELERAWNLMMKKADEVGVYDVLDFAPPLTEYAHYRATIELYAQEHFYMLMKDGTDRYSEYLNSWKSQGGTASTKEINDWYLKR